MDQPQYRNQTIVGRTLEWGDPQLTTFVEGSIFRDCEIVITCSARGIIIGDSSFENCRIKVTKSFAGYQFFDTTFNSCQFAGSFPGCEFGFRAVCPSRLRGYVSGCDFRRAMLDEVAINSSEVSSLLLPPWPHFAVLNERVFMEVASLDADPRWILYRDIGWQPETAALVIRYRTRGRHAFEVSEDEARTALAAHGSVFIAAA